MPNVKTGRWICLGLLIVWATHHFSQLRIVLVAACLFASTVWAGENPVPTNLLLNADFAFHAFQDHRHGERRA